MMPKSKTRLMHTTPTERPFYCITGDLSGEGLLVIVDKSTHELLVQEGAEAGTFSVIVNPKGAQVQGVSVRPGTRMLDLQPPPSDPMRQAEQSIERLKSGAIGAPRRLRCFNCEEEGHGAADCPHPDQDDEPEAEGRVGSS